MRGLKPRDFVEIKLIDTLSEKNQNCPVCRLINESIEKLVDTILYELVNDPEIRTNFRNSGLCKRHAEIIERYLERHPELGLLGIAIIYEDMLQNQIDLISQNDFDSIKNKNCYLCERENEVEKTYISSFIRIFSENDGLDLFEKSSCILCFDHYYRISTIVDESFAERLKKIQSAKLSNLKDQLSIFIQKHDYRNKQPFGKEAVAYKVAGALMGKPVNFSSRRNTKWQIWKNSKEK